MRRKTLAVNQQSDRGASPRAAAAAATITVTTDGPLVVCGSIEMVRDNGHVATVARVALCRCGASTHKPLCDGSHRSTGFREAGAVATPVSKPGDPLGDSTTLRVLARTDGPLWIEGGMQVVDGSGAIGWEGSAAALCRCGASARKPFCDGAHKTIGFRSGT